jgi:2-dehydropantoate 2-reductase
MNGLGVEERFAAWFGPERIFGVLAFVCLTRGEPGHVDHLGYGALTIGHYLDDADLLAEAAALWQGTPIAVSTTPSLLRARWEKLCWNVPFNGLTIAAGGVPTDRILADASLRETARDLMAEVIAAGNADLASHGLKPDLDAAEIIPRMFRLTETMAGYRPSTLLDFLAGRSLEVETIFEAPLNRARALNIETPRLSMLTSLLRSLNATRSDT